MTDTELFKITDPACCGVRLVDEDGCCIACGRDFCDPDTGQERGDGSRVPNEQLKDTALDLLEALKDLRDIVEVMGEYPSLNKARAAIAKATGE